MKQFGKMGVSMIIATTVLAGCAAPISTQNVPRTAPASDAAYYEQLPGVARVSRPPYVWIDTKSPEYTVYVAIPAQSTSSELKKIREKASASESVQLVSWGTFLKSGVQLVDGKIKRDDYPKVNQRRGITSLVRKFPGSAWAVTWNGGIALTGNDYRHARSTYKRYKADNNAKTRNGDRRLDPVHPMNHLGPLLGTKSSGQKR